MYKYKLAIIFLFLTQFLYSSSELFDENCKKCHTETRQLDMFISKYTLKYSSEPKIKDAIFEYLKNPNKENSVMPLGFLSRFGIKEKIELDDKILMESINQYYELYNLKKRIK